MKTNLIQKLWKYFNKYVILIIWLLMNHLPEVYIFLFVQMRYR